MLHLLRENRFKNTVMPRSKRTLLGFILSTWVLTFFFSKYLAVNELKTALLKLGSLNLTEHEEATRTGQDFSIEVGNSNGQDYFRSLLHKNDLIARFGTMLNSSQRAAITRMYGKVLLGSSYLTSKEDRNFWKIPFPMKKILIVSSDSRSGSSFTGDLISSFPGSFYTFEPLAIFGEPKYEKKSQQEEETSVQIVREWLSCSFKNHSDHLNGFLNKTFHMKKSHPTTEVCSSATELCRDQDFMEHMCSMHPVNVVKVIRMWLSDVENYLEDENFGNLKVVVLVRDPRAVLASNKAVGWCKKSCTEIMEGKCRKITDDLANYDRLIQKYPGRLYLMRHEDLSSNVTDEARSLFKFLELPMSQETEDFIWTHTIATIKDNFDTRRNSSSVPYQWLSALNQTEARRVEELCRDLMERAGYPLLRNQSKDAFRY